MERNLSIQESYEIFNPENENSQNQSLYCQPKYKKYQGKENQEVHNVHFQRNEEKKDQEPIYDLEGQFIKLKISQNNVQLENSQNSTPVKKTRNSSYESSQSGKSDQENRRVKHTKLKRINEILNEDSSNILQQVNSNSNGTEDSGDSKGTQTTTSNYQITPNTRQLRSPLSDVTPGSTEKKILTLRDVGMNISPKHLFLKSPARRKKSCNLSISDKEKTPVKDLR